MDEKELQEHIDMMFDMWKNPEKYGTTAEEIHQWAVDNFKTVSGIIGRIPESLRDGLADAAIDAYNEQKMRDG